MLNVGEQLVSSYLRYIRKCDFIQTNLYTVESQGEIDVVGLNIAERQVYICEVAIHLTTGLQYVKNKRPNNVKKLTDKFSRDIEYARKYFGEYNQHFMLWSPIVKDPKGKPEYNQVQHLAEIEANIKRQWDIDIECIVNEKFYACLEELRLYAATQTAALQCPLTRLMQIEELLGKHVSNHHTARPAIDIQAEEKTEGEYSEFWEPIREENGLFAGKPVPIRDEHYISKHFCGVEMHLRLNNHECYVLLAFSGPNKAEKKEHRDKIMKLFPECSYEHREAKKAISVVFPVLNKGRKDPEYWPEMREKLVNMGTKIYNKINESNL